MNRSSLLSELCDADAAAKHWEVRLARDIFTVGDLVQHYQERMKLMSNDQEVKVLANITNEEAQELRNIKIKRDELNSAATEWFDAMAEKYGFPKRIPCHVNFNSKTIYEGFGYED